jgi:monofunctional biosynthetic peptidoglycan transglycosylase
MFKDNLFKTIPTFVLMFKWIFRIGLLFLVFTVFGVLLLRWIPITYTPLMFIRSIQSQTNDKLPSGIHHDWVSLSEAGPFPTCVQATEDQNFYDHHGFDFKAIQFAYEYNKNHEKTIGASTISQQTAKNVFLWPSRSWVRKGLEVYFTALIELLWGKDRILEVYSNVVELGPGIYGVEAASQHYFNVSASSLKNNQALNLATLLPSPLKYSPIDLNPAQKRKKSRAKKHLKKSGALKF